MIESLHSQRKRIETITTKNTRKTHVRLSATNVDKVLLKSAHCKNMEEFMIRESRTRATTKTVEWLSLRLLISFDTKEFTPE